jgi:hypothetical protein
LSQFVITRRIVVAGGVFAPGHLGELTRIVPFEMVDAVLAECGATQRRLRKLPARVVVYLLLAAALFEPAGYPAVWRKLTSALEDTAAAVTAAALWQARTRLGPAPLRALFDLLRGSAAAPRTSGSWWHGLLVCAIDGTTLDVPDTPGHRARLGKRDNQYATAGYPQVRLAALVACGTRAIIDAVFGPMADGEPAYAARLAGSLRQGMIVLLDRGLSGNALLAGIASAEADFLARLSASRKPPVLCRLPDGSFLSVLGGVKVRIIECQVTIATTAGTQTGTYRLAATLLDHRQHPAFELVKLYHQRWEIESAYFEIKKTMLGRASCAPAPCPASPRKSTHCSPSTRPCASPSPTPPSPPPAPTPTAPASPPPSRPPATRSSRPQASSPQKPSTWPAPSAATSWTTCYPPAACASAPAPSSAPCPATPTRASA